MAAAGNMIEQRAMSDRSGLKFDGLSLILGLGLSGVSAARFIHAHGGELRIVDSRSAPPGLDAVAALGAQVITESLDARWLDGVQRVVLSPGLSIDLPICAAARERGIEIVNDIELFARFANAPIVAVTGSNGKSTVVSLVAQMLQRAGINAPAGGNLGPPALDLLDDAADAYVLEISSFQMEAVQSLHPTAAAVLNVSPDHLDRHSSVAAYAALKEKLLTSASLAVVNCDDARVAQMGRQLGNVVEYSLERDLPRGCCVRSSDDGEVIAIDAKVFMRVDELGVTARHDIANVLAALALARSIVDAPEAFAAALRDFRGLPHRCERVAQIDGVTWVNDSKATNVGAAAAALSGYDVPVVLIAGGQSKGADFSELAQAARERLRCAIVMGVDAPLLEDALLDIAPVYRVADMSEAVAVARARAQAGDVVLLSPACASLDMFENYAARGEAFRAAVAELQT